MKKKKVVIIGSGPAGLTAAYELLDKSNKYEVTVLEELNIVGGISRTVNYKGNRMDMGGHRFFSKDERVNEWWEKILPSQGSLPKDDKILNRTSTLTEGGPNPDKTEPNLEVNIYENKITFSIVYLSIIQPNDMTVIGTCISVEQFCYGFGFTAYTVYLLQCAKGEYETVHYAFLTALMAIGMALPTIISGYWQQDIGYPEFFIRACWLTLPGMAMSIWYVLKHENKK